MIHRKFLLLSIVFALLLTNELKAIQLESIVQAVPWEYGMEPDRLPKHWQKHKARQSITLDYVGAKITIPKGDNYFTYKGKVAIGWHGTYNPPCGM
jgi:hypothetical protein